MIYKSIIQIVEVSKIKCEKNEKLKYERSNNGNNNN